jgi:hypothetical protein
VQDSLRVQTFRLPLSVQPDSVVLDPDGWILKQIVPITEVQEREVLPSGFALSQNYPNPFNPSTTIRFSVGTNSHTSLQMFDLLGREVATLVNENKSPGTYHVQFDGSSLSSGIYVYRLTAGGFVETKKMILLR